MGFQWTVRWSRYSYLPMVVELEDRTCPGFLAPLAYDAGPYPWSVATGDFKGDGVLDLAVTNLTNAGTVSVLLGNGDGTFQAPRSFRVGEFPFALATADFRGAGMVRSKLRSPAST